jgi:Holliday junction resolvase RusA-like endonuclease
MTELSLSPTPFSISFVVPGEAKQFARAGSRGAQRFTPRPQRDYMAAVKMFAQTAMGDEPPRTGPLALTMRVEYLIPPSWSKKRRDAAKWKTTAPDADNLAKIVKDALNKIVYCDDAQIAYLVVQKVYSEFARSTICVTELCEGGAR